MQLVIRFIVGGALVATVPLLGRYLSPQAAGVAVLFPVVTLVAFTFLGRDLGRDALSSAAGSALIAVPTIIAFLVGTKVALAFRMPSSIALGAGLMSWLTTAAIVVLAGHLRLAR